MTTPPPAAPAEVALHVRTSHRDSVAVQEVPLPSMGGANYPLHDLAPRWSSGCQPTRPTCLGPRAMAIAGSRCLIRLRRDEKAN
jgi:hypothetical protein